MEAQTEIVSKLSFDCDHSTANYADKNGNTEATLPLYSLFATKGQWAVCRSIMPIAPSHIDPYGALFNCIGHIIDLGLSAAVNILVDLPPS